MAKSFWFHEFFFSFQGIYEPLPLSQELSPSCLGVRSKYNEVTNGDELNQEILNQGNIIRELKVKQDPFHAELAILLDLKSKYEVATGKPWERNLHESSKSLNFRDIYFFDDGSVIFWNVPLIERNSVLELLRSSDGVQTKPFDEDDIEEESEMLRFGAAIENTQLQKGEIKLGSTPELETQIHEKYAFSNAIAASVKLGMLESKLDRFIDSIEIAAVEDLRRYGKINMSEKKILQKTGEIFAIRHSVNLSSDLLDTPDFYWDREVLEQLYNQTSRLFILRKRTEVMNKKMDYCLEVMDLLRDSLNLKQSHFLEKLIIGLIMIEVFFEAWHFFKS